MKKVQEPTVTKTLTMAASRTYWRPLIGLLTAIVVMSVVVLSGEELKHLPPVAPSFAVLYSFGGYPTDGTNPQAGLLRDAAGNLYGTTFYGGSGNCFDIYASLAGCGVVFKLSAMGTEKVLYSFAGPPDGQYPVAGLTQDAAGNLYGTTEFGGVYNDYCENPNPHNAYTCGVVFKLSPSGTETVLHTFAGRPTDGGNPYAGLLRDAAGNLYGTTLNGGAHGSGVVFKLSPTGTETLLHTFTGPDGARPSAGLIKDTLGNLYGTTEIGGACAYTGDGCGVVFELIRCSSSPSGYDFKVLHTFTGGADGAYPVAALVRDAAGNLYGTTSQGGGTHNGGVVFRLTP